jgi:hypothetical protein
VLHVRRHRHLAKINASAHRSAALAWHLVGAPEKAYLVKQTKLVQNRDAATTRSSSLGRRDPAS